MRGPAGMERKRGLDQGGKGRLTQIYTEILIIANHSIILARVSIAFVG